METSGASNPLVFNSHRGSHMPTDTCAHACTHSCMLSSPCYSRASGRTWNRVDYDQELGTNSSFVELLATCVLLKKSHQWLRLQNGFHKFCMFILATLHGADLKPLHTPFLEPSLCKKTANPQEKEILFTQTCVLLLFCC